MSEVLGYLVLAVVVALVLYRDLCIDRYEAARLRARQKDGEK